MGELQIPVGFRFVPGVRRAPFDRVRLSGSWDEDGHASVSWREVEMTPSRSDDGGQAWAATVLFDPGMVGRQFRWGVLLDGPQGQDLWGIPEPAPGREPWERHQSFVLRAASESDIQLQSYLLAAGRHRGCRKIYPPEGGKPGLGFAVWAPHAWKVEVVFLKAAHGYVADDGTGLDRRRGPFELSRGADDVWRIDPSRQPALADFAAFEGRPYMYRVTLKGGKVVYRTDMYSRVQAGQGDVDPEGAPYLGTPEELDGTVSGSLVVDPDVVFGISKGRCSAEFGRFPSREFWRDELRGDRPKVERLGDLVIYEMHVGALGTGTRPGTLADATAHLDHLAELGVNAVELMPVAEFDGWASWGYGSSHPMAIEASAGGRHQLMHFVREAHRRGLLVFVDVVYNHFASRALRAAWQYDSVAPEENIYYWYEGVSADYPTPDGGYLDNGSSGYAPDYASPEVRRLFLAAAVELVEDFQVDGFRVDLTDAIHAGNRRVADSAPVPAADAAGAAFLRQWTRSLKMLRPELWLIAEDHTGHHQVLGAPDAGGLGFDGRWRSSFYHHLIGDAQPGEHWARLLDTMARQDEGPLPMRRFAAALQEVRGSDVVYHESHDEAGNSTFHDGSSVRRSKRTLQVAAAGRPLDGRHRPRAEALTRAVAGLAMLTPGAALFLMGEEVGASEEYRYDDFLWHREDLAALRKGRGRDLFAFFRDVIALRKRSPALRQGDLEVLRADDEQRLLVFVRRHQGEEVLVILSGHPRGFPRGYRIHGLGLADGDFREVLNSGQAAYGGELGTRRAPTLSLRGGTLEPVLPAHGLLVFQRS